MPTKFEQMELLNYCTWIWYDLGNSEFGGVAGYKVTSNKEDYTGRFIFLPAAGYRSGTLDPYFGFGSYWSSSADPYVSSDAYDLRFTSGSHNEGNGVNRYNGYSVRPVCP